MYYMILEPEPGFRSSPRRPWDPAGAIYRWGPAVLGIESMNLVPKEPWGVGALIE